jgi:hypothetical protein
MDDRLVAFRAGAGQMGERRRGRKFPKELRAIAGEYARVRRDEGASWQEIADELGVAVPTSQRWSEEGVGDAATFKTVRVADGPRHETFTVTMGALRVEGLAFEALVALAKALS